MKSPFNVYKNKFKTKEKLLKEKEGMTIEQSDIALNYFLNYKDNAKEIDYSNKVEVFLTSGSKKAPKQFNEKLGSEAIYQKISPFFNYVNDINSHTRAKQSGTQLINNAIEIDKINFSHTKAKINGSISGIQEAVKNFQDSVSFNVFDTETRSGRGSNGVQELDGLTELSFRAYDRVDGKVIHNKEKSLETIIGITNEEFETYEKIFKDEFNEHGMQNVEKNSVIAKAFAKLGHKDTTYSPNPNLPGIFTMDTYVGDDTKNLMSQENILRGLQKYRDIGIAQESARTQNGLMAWEEMMLEAAHRINTEVSVGYNSENFDIKVMDQAVGRIWRGIKDPTAKANLGAKYGIAPGGSFNVRPNKGSHLDVFNISKTVASIKGKHGVLGDNKESFRIMSETGLTALTQEILGKTYVPESFKAGVAAHTAGADVDVLANLVSSEFLTDSMNLIDEQDIFSGAIKKNDIFIANNGSYHNSNTGEHALSFTKNSATGNIRLFNGYDLKPDGTVEYFDVGKATGLKKNVAYEVTGMTELDVNDEMVTELAKINQDYARNKLYALEMTPLINKDIAGNNEILQDKVVQLFTSIEHMEGFATSNVLRIGQFDGTKYVSVSDIKEAKAVKEALGTRTIKDGVVSESKESTIQEIIDRGSLISANDSAARAMRDNDYSKAVKFQKVQDILQSNGYKTVDSQRRRLDMITSSQVAQGKDLKINHSILSVLEYNDKASKQKRIHPGSINNLVNSYEYMASRRNVVDKLVDAANKTSKDSGGRQLAYDTLMQGLRNDAANSINPNNSNLAGNNSVPLEVYNKDLGYYEIQMPDGYFKQLNNKATPDEINDIVRINLNDPNEYGFMNDLFRRTRGDNLAFKNKNTKEAYLVEELNKFIKEVNVMEGHEGVFDDLIKGMDEAGSQITIGDKVPSAILAEQIKEKLAINRANNPTAGYLKDTTQEIVLASDKLLENLDDSFIEKSISKNIGLVPTTRTLDAASDIQVMSTAEHIVDQIFMPKVRNAKGELLTNLEDITAFAEQTYGFNEEQSKLMLDQFNMMRSDYVEGISSMVKAVTKFNGSTMSMDADRRKLSIGINGTNYILDQIPRVEFKNGMVHLVTGSNRVAGGLKVYAKDAVNGDVLNTNNVEISSVLKGMLSPLGGLDYSMNRANRRNENVGNAFISAISKVGENARAGSAIDTYTSKNINSLFTLDFTEALETLAYQVDEIVRYPHWKDKEFPQIIKKNADQLKRGVVSPAVKEASIKNLQDILMMTKGIQPGEKLNTDKMYERVVANLNSYTKATTLTDGKIHLTDYDATPLGEFDGKTRPPISSTDEVIIRKSDVEKLATKEGFEGKIRPGARITNKRLGAKKTIDGVGEVVTGVTYKTANVSEDAFKTIVQAELDMKIKLAGTAKEKEMLENAKKVVSGYNLTEQGKLMDFEMVKAFTSGIEDQYISLKNFEKDLRINTDTMQTRLKNAMPALEIAKSGDIVFSLGKQSMVKKGTPLASMRGYGGAIETIGVKEDLGFFGLKVFGYNSKLQVGESAVGELLNANKKSLIGPDGKIDEVRAYNLIRDNFDIKMHVENAFSPTYVKNTIEAAEKGMYEAIVAPAGSLDKRVGDILDSVGLSVAKGRVLQDKTIDEVVNRYNNLSEESKRLLGLSDNETVKGIIENERSLMSSVVRDIDAFKGSLAYANDNTSKHRNAGMSTKSFINNTVDYYVSQGMTYEEASKKTVSEIKDRNIIEGLDIGFDGNQIQIGRVDYNKATINNKALENFTNEIGLYDKNSSVAIMHDDKVVGYTSVNESSFNIDFSGTAGSSRHLNNLQESLYEASSDLTNLTSGSAEYDAKQSQIKDLTRKLEVAKRNHKTMKISSRETNMLGLLTYDNDKMNNLRSAVGEENYQKMYGVMLDADGNISSEYQGRSIHNSFLKDIQHKFNRQAEEVSSYHDKGIEAVEYNKNPLQFEDTMAGRDFENVNINDIVLPKGEGSDFLENNENSAINRNMLVSTGVYDGSGKELKVAVPKANYSITGDTINTDDVQKSLSSLQSASIRLEEGRKGVFGKGETIDSLTENVKSRVGDVREAVIERQRKLYKGLESVNVDGYAYEKASMSHYTKGNLYEALNVSEFEGKSLANWADEGVHLDYSHHGRGYFERLGYFDEKTWNGKYGMKSVGQMEEHLSKFGTTGLESRTPTIQGSSVSVAKQYLDTSLNYNETKTSSPLALGRNQDQDGDKVLQAEVKYNGYTQVDYDVMKNSKDAIIPDDVTEYFEETKRAQFYKGATVNKRIYENKANPLYESDKNIPMKNSNVNEVLKASSMDGETVMPHMQVEAESSVVNDNLAKYKRLEAEAGMSYGEEGFNALDDSQKRSAIKDFISNSNFSDAEVDDYNSTMRFKDIYTRDSAAKMSKVAGKASIGTINLPLYSLRIAGGARMNDDEKQLFQTAAYVIEEKMISKKHDNEVDISMAESVKDSINSLIRGDSSKISVVKDVVNERLQDDIYTRIQNETDLDLSKYDKETTMNTINNLWDKLGRMAREDNNFKAEVSALNASRVFSEDTAEEVLRGIRGSTSSASLTAMANNGYDMGRAKVSYSAFDNSGFESSAKKVSFEAVEDVVKKISTSGIGMAALGLAATVMATGYIGGNPTIAPGNETNAYDDYESLQDEDLSIQRLPQGSSQGYVVNINAQGAKGKDHAMKAIQQAMQTSMPTDINIAMSMEDKRSIIDTRFIDNLLSKSI